MYEQGIIHPTESNLRIPKGMMNELSEINSSKLGRIVYNTIGILLFTALIGSCGYELFIKPIKEMKPTQELQESAERYLEYISQDFK
jgi:hypothetical protein